MQPKWTKGGREMRPFIVDSVTESQSDSVTESQSETESQSHRVTESQNRTTSRWVKYFMHISLNSPFPSLAGG